ncbi:hypothetical protein BJ138DRAFT_143438 [Hygrophoropsis aurantiaca]|uniref:Uncharacterized protein n=1 Tax=Hygrophoropsis aurantiaca TaxID=72124 RepID=A0ACB8ABR6_9AGAM|nr:hypothetical protein BJ138DRAFT_143438 [Hygrophoropsis aurantiaca]
MSSHSVRLNPLLTSTPADHRYYAPVPVQWDVRDKASIALRSCAPKTPLSSSQLAQHATIPAIPSLRINCDVISASWPIVAYNPAGVTIRDIMETINAAVRTPLHMAEWQSLNPKQQRRIGDIFEERWRTSQDQWRVRTGGVRRMDCLISTTMFGGLSFLTCANNQWTAVLTLSRQTRRHRLTSYSQS